MLPMDFTSVRTMAKYLLRLHLMILFEIIFENSVMTVVTGLFLGGLLVLITDFWNSSREQAAIAQQVSSKNQYLRHRPLSRE